MRIVFHRPVGKYIIKQLDILYSFLNLVGLNKKLVYKENKAQSGQLLRQQCLPHLFLFDINLFLSIKRNITLYLFRFLNFFLQPITAQLSIFKIYKKIVY